MLVGVNDERTLNEKACTGAPGIGSAYLEQTNKVSEFVRAEVGEATDTTESTATGSGALDPPSPTITRWSTRMEGACRWPCELLPPWA
mmetsp:Transcript_41603/g.109747  ORF Transcript_41603/g.109747 Transcript_41603/m.109747 type:complete len:88 (-) Transcript_41603:1461-1724(-)